MTRARTELISLTDTPYYHCISRCVRRSFLCGRDRYSGKDYSHRRAWIMERIQTLSSMFAIDVCAYAIMSNHYHLVLKADAKRMRQWSNEVVIQRWNILFGGPDLVKRFQSGVAMSPAEINKVNEIVATWRERLADISWYMRALNEHIARLGNAEDACTGRFWEGRFKSQALLDEQALLTCMAYVDLNPIRAKMTCTPETSDFTSVQQRIAEIIQQPEQTCPGELHVKPTAHCPLLKFIGWVDSNAGIPFRLVDYIELVDWSGRIMRADKSGSIPGEIPSILLRLGIDDSEYLKHVSPKSASQPDARNATGFYSAIGSAQSLKQAADHFGKKFIKGMSKAQRMYSNREITSTAGASLDVI